MPKFSIVLVALGLLFSHTAIAQDAENSQEVIIPLFSQKLSFNLPDGWRATDQDVTKGIAYVEFGKNDYSDSDNKDRLRVYIFKNLARTKSLEEILGGIVSTDNEHCADNLQITTRYMDSFSNREATYTTHFCSQKVRPTIINEQEYASETSYVSAMLGKKDAYVIIYDFLHREPHSKSPLDLRKLGNILEEKGFLPIRLCKKSGPRDQCTPE